MAYDRRNLFAGVDRRPSIQGNFLFGLTVALVLGAAVTKPAQAMQFASGSYTGNGVSGRSIAGVGFQPNYAIVMAESAKPAVQRSSAMTGDTSFQFDAKDAIANLIQALNADGFQVGGDARVNASGIVYHYATWKAVAGKMQVGSYAGNGADNRDITGVGFQPKYVLIKSSGKNAALHRPTSLSGDSALLFTAASNLANAIQALQADGFQVGTDLTANASGSTYFWMVFGPG